MKLPIRQIAIGRSERSRLTQTPSPFDFGVDTIARSKTRQIRTATLIRRGKLKLPFQVEAVAWIGQHIEANVLLILGGPVFFQIARAAFRLNLIGLLRRSPGLSLQKIQQQIGLSEEPSRVLLQGCVALKILRKRRGKYYCRRTVLAKLLDPAEPENLKPMLEWMHHIIGPSMKYFEEALRTETAAGLQAFPGDEDNLYGRIDRDPELQRVFYEGMNARTRAIIPIFLDRIDFSKIQNVLDVGGGDGEILATIAERHPHLRGVVLEIPSVAQKAHEHFVQLDLSDRLTSVAANIFHDAFPAQHDCILFCHVCANHSQETNRELMMRAYAALLPGGFVMIISAFMHNDEAGPLSSALASAYFVCTVTGKGRQYSWNESAAWMTAAGFVDVTCVRLLMNQGVILGQKP